MPRGVGYRPGGMIKKVRGRLRRRRPGGRGGPGGPGGIQRPKAPVGGRPTRRPGKVTNLVPKARPAKPGRKSTAALRNRKPTLTSKPSRGIASGRNPSRRKIVANPPAKRVQARQFQAKRRKR